MSNHAVKWHVLPEDRRLTRARFKVFPRYWCPSLKTALGIARAKRRALRRMGYYSGPMAFFRFMRCHRP